MADYTSIGEILLRLKSPANERLFQSPSLEATFGGGEANVAVALSNYGLDSAFVSALPDNPVGDAAIRELQSFGVATRGQGRQSKERYCVLRLQLSRQFVELWQERAGGNARVGPVCRRRHRQ